MIATITMAHVSGPLRQALAVIDGETWLYEIARDRRRPIGNDIKLFFDHGLEIRALGSKGQSALSPDELLTMLDAEASRFRALRDLLIGMDPDFDDDLRRRSMIHAEHLLADPQVSDFVTRRFVRPVDHQAWNVATARQLAQAAALPSVERQYALVDGPLLLQLEEQIRVWASHKTFNSLGYATLVDQAYDNGLISTLATAIHNGDHLRMQELVFQATVEHWNSHLVAYLVNQFSPKQEQEQVQIETGSRNYVNEGPEGGDQVLFSGVRSRIRTALKSYQLRRRREGRRHRIVDAGAEGLDATLKQIDWIAARFVINQPGVAWNAVADLAERQLREGNRDRLTMSLTNLATRFEIRPDVAFALCDLAALCAPDDPIVRNSRATLLRKSDRLPEALEAYEQTVKDFPSDVAIRNGLAETLRAMGRLPEALAAYEQTVKDFPSDIFARNGLAETLRAMGRLPEALEAYELTIKDFPFPKFVRNGYAVVLSELDRLAEAREVVQDFGPVPRAKADWVAAHILCMIDLRDGSKAALAERLHYFVKTCPYQKQQRYFETTLAVVLFALNQVSAVRQSLTDLVRRPGFQADEHIALHLMKAHAEAADGDLDAAGQSLATASNIVPFELFRTRRLHQEIERRFELSSTPALIGSDQIAASDETLLWLEMEFWTASAIRPSVDRRLAA